ncbi:MAG: PAC2 family protein [Candidatus Bathyarchaeota archaeon]|nr:PAC2 family protein [Candidatus Bathyarchaeota archaeon]
MEVYFKEKPSLRNPTLIAAWPGMGMLARMSADYLIQQLDAKQFAEIRSPSNDIYFKDGMGKLSQYRHRFYYYNGKQSDLIVCSGEIQPQSLSAIQQLANQVLDVAEEFGTKRVYTFAAVPNPHDVKPRVFGVVNKPELRDFLKENGVQLVSGDGRITGLNGLLIGIAQQRGIDGICLLCEIRYLDIPQPRSVQTVLNTLTKILGIEIELSELERQAKEMEEKIEKIREHRTPQEGRPKEPRYIS